MMTMNKTDFFRVSVQVAKSKNFCRRERESQQSGMLHDGHLVGKNYIQFCAIWNITQGHEKRAIYFVLSWLTTTRKAICWFQPNINLKEKNRVSSKITSFSSISISVEILYSATLRFVTQRAVETSSVEWKTGSWIKQKKKNIYMFLILC